MLKIHNPLKYPKVSILVLFIISLLIYYGYNLLLNDNFHTVIANQVYRSAQPTPQNLRAYIKHYHIESIINLRGKSSGSDWYDDEIAVSDKNHINHFDIALNAHQVPSVQTFNRLIKLIETAPRPILFHCRAGADRTGLASALSIILSGDASLDHLEDQVSWQYAALSPTTVGYQVVQNYLHWLKANHKTNSTANFIAWDRGLQHLKLYQGWFLT